MKPLNKFPHNSPRLGLVAEIHSRVATWADINHMVWLRCGEDLDWWAAETLGHWCLENTGRQMVLWNCDRSDDQDDDHGNGNSKGGGQDKGGNTSEGKLPVRPDHCGDDDNGLSEDDDKRAVQVVAHVHSKTVGDGTCKASIWNLAYVIKLTV